MRKPGDEFELKVHVQYFASARELVGTHREDLDVPEGCTVRSLLDSLLSEHGTPLKNYLFDPKTGGLRPSIQLLVGEESIRETGGMSTVLVEGSTFAIIPPVGGG